MKKLILILMFILGTFSFAKITDQEVESFFSPKTKVYVSNQKNWFYGIFPGDGDGENSIWKELNFFINVLPVGNKYRVSYTPIQDVESYDKEGYPILSYRIENDYYSDDQQNQGILMTDSYDINIMVALHPGTEIRNNGKYTRNSYQVLSENELNALLKSKNAKRLDSATEKNTKTFLNWLFHNTN